MSRAGSLSQLGCYAVALAALPAVARADVMEIGAQGPAWISGGPAFAAPSPDGQTGALALAEAAGPAAESYPASFTAIDAAAGPDRWRTRVAVLAAKYDISPALLEAVVWQESRWNTAAVSPVGARGLAQLMPGTARQLGVDPHDPDANLEGGARYLRMQLDAFDGNVEKALAAYNAGPLRVTRAGGVPNIRETQLYVAAILGRLSQPVRR